MKRLNTYTVYQLAVGIHPLTELAHKDGMKLGDISWPLFKVELNLRPLIKETGFFSPSLKRAAGDVLRNFRQVGLGESFEEIFKNDDKPLESWQVNSLTRVVKDFETVLANELPGLAIYHVSPQGIFSTDELISEADKHLPSSIHKQVSEKAQQDIREAGKCLAFELSTAAAFHMWRALETVMDSYHQSLTTQTFETAKVTRNWGAYIKALDDAGAEKKITVFLDHIRAEYRNPVSHPTETVAQDDALNLFSTGLSAISQTTKEIIRTAAAPISGGTT